MFNSYLNQLNKFNPYAIYNVKNKSLIQTLRKLESLSMSKDASNKDVRTEIAKEQIQTQIQKNENINQIFEVYWNSSYRTMISFEQFSQNVKKYHQDVDYKITLEWIGQVVFDPIDKNYRFIPILFKVDNPIIFNPEDMPQEHMEVEKDVKGRLLFRADDEAEIVLLSLKNL